MNYFAVEIHNQPDHVLTETVVRTAAALGLRFKKLEVMNRFTLGATKFLRFRTQGDIGKLLDCLFTTGLCVIGQDSSGFVARMKSRKGAVSTTTMLASASITPLVFRGPGAQFWERQFQAPD